MTRRFLLALALGSTLAVPMANVYAEGDEEKKPDSQLILSEGDEEKKPDSQLILSEGDEDKKPDQPQLLG
jgi:hypothetical protein